MALTSERHAAVDAELANIHAYLVALADGIDREAPLPTNRAQRTSRRE
jgi:hypothetical protein